MKSSLALAAVAAVIAIGSFVGTTSNAAALDLSFLTQMNPEYKRCVNNVRSQVRGPIDRKLHDAIIDACNARYPAYPRR
jgi:hypothetical protein